ncbi:MAG: hypothetical protein HY744_13905 [Deltaproteobacteria bacterium]|nr:hypothetical protein [Deltaproteobacteria bacterium]
MLLDEVSEADRDEVLAIFGRRGKVRAEARRWFHAHLWRREGIMEDVKIEELEGYDEVMVEMLASLPPEQRLAGLTPEQILSVLTPEQLRSLAEAIRRKLGD